MAASDDSGLEQRLPWGRRSSPEASGLEGAGGGVSDLRLPWDRVAQPEPDEAKGEGAVAEQPGTPPGDAEGSSDVLPLTSADHPDVRLPAVDAATGLRIDDGLDRLHRTISAGFERLDEQVAASNAGHEARLDKLEAHLDAIHTASVEVVGLLAGQLVAGLEQQVAALAAAAQERHEELLARVLERQDDLLSRLEANLLARQEDLMSRLEGDLLDLAARLEAGLVERHEDLVARQVADQAATMEAVGELASGRLLDRLVEGVITLGEVLDADLAHLRRLLTDQRLDSDAPTMEVASPRRDPVDGGEGTSI